jgi:hypothetical protein
MLTSLAPVPTQVGRPGFGKRLRAGSGATGTSITLAAYEKLPKLLRDLGVPPSFCDFFSCGNIAQSPFDHPSLVSCWRAYGFTVHNLLVSPYTLLRRVCYASRLTKALKPRAHMSEKYVYTEEEIRSIKDLLQNILKQVEPTLPRSARTVVAASISEVTFILAQGLARRSLTYIDRSRL